MYAPTPEIFNLFRGAWKKNYSTTTYVATANIRPPDTFVERDGKRNYRLVFFFVFVDNDWNQVYSRGHSNIWVISTLYHPVNILSIQNNFLLF